MRNAVATVERGAGGSNLTNFFIAERFIVHWGVSETVGHGIDHYFQQMNEGGDLARGQTLDQFMDLLLFARVCHQE